MLARQHLTIPYMCGVVLPLEYLKPTNELTQWIPSLEGTAYWFHLGGGSMGRTAISFGDTSPLQAAEMAF